MTESTDIFQCKVGTSHQLWIQPLTFEIHISDSFVIRNTGRPPKVERLRELKLFIISM